MNALTLKHPCFRFMSFTKITICLSQRQQSISVYSHILCARAPGYIQRALPFCAQEEIEKVKKRRLDREKDRAEQEEMVNMLQRERGQAEAIELERKEEVFHLEQAKARAKQRIKDGR